MTTKLPYRTPYHLVNISPWPAFVGLGTLILTSSIICLFYTKWTTGLKIRAFIVLVISLLWWRDVAREGSQEGIHTFKVQDALRLGLILFIISEIIFFSSFFWAFFYSGYNALESRSLIWPPTGVHAIHPQSAPLVNTVILLISGIAATAVHRALPTRNRKGSSLWLFVAILLGAWFAGVQWIEYGDAGFRLADRVFGSTFFVATGFHGAHVIIGATALSACLLRRLINQFTNTRHFGYEAAAWYWHFVDVVWLFLFIVVYWWRI